MSEPGAFVFSVDFELFWGVHHNRAYADYGPNLHAARENLPKLSALFRAYGLRFTCASVGLLYAQDWAEAAAALPTERPRYINPDLSPYPKLDIFQSDYPSELFFAPDLLNRLRADGQEMATHTFAHYFCQEPGADVAAFAADLAAAKRLAEAHGDRLRSIVFPRNQFSDAHLEVCRAHGIRAYRGNPTSGWFDKKSHRLLDVYKRVARGLDAFVNLTGHNGYRPRPDEHGMIDVKAAAFLRPASGLPPGLRALHLRRIKRSMTHAARRGLVYHLWCHPHNLRTARDLAAVEVLLRHYRKLADRFGFANKTMGDFVDA